MLNHFTGVYTPNPKTWKKGGFEGHHKGSPDRGEESEEQVLSFSVSKKTGIRDGRLERRKFPEVINLVFRAS